MRKLLLCALLIGGACGDDDEGSQLDLDERRFRLVTGHDVVTGTTPTLSFDEAELTFYAGCNTSTGSFTARDGKLTVGDLATTLIGCDAAHAAQDQYFTAFLAADPKIALKGDTLTLTGSDTILVFIEEL